MEILNQARAKEHVHPNVGHALSELLRKQEAETETESSVLDASHEQRQFLLSFAEAYFRKPTSTPQFEGSWRFRDGVEATVTRNDDGLKITWTQGDGERVMAARVRNRGAKITDYLRQNQYLSTSLEDKGYAYHSEDVQHMNIMVLTNKNHSFLTLERQA